MGILPEPPNGTRIEFEYFTDVYAAWRDDEASRIAGWPVGDGGRTWCLYPSSVPVSWDMLCAEFGDDPNALALAVRLIPHPEDLAKRAMWPTQVK